MVNVKYNLYSTILSHFYTKNKTYNETNIKDLFLFIYNKFVDDSKKFLENSTDFEDLDLSVYNSYFSDIDINTADLSFDIFESLYISILTKYSGSLQKELGVYVLPFSVCNSVVITSLTQLITNKLESDPKRTDIIRFVMGLSNYLNDDDSNVLLSILINIKCIDISCGTGNFILSYILVIKQLLERLSGSNNKIEFVKYYLSIVIDNLFATDINYISALITTLRIKLLLNIYGIDTDLSNFKHLNILSASQFDNLKFDLIIGDPLYSVKIPIDELEFYSDKYNFDTYEINIFYILRCFELCCDNGVIGLTLPKSFKYTAKYEGIRNFTFKYLTSLCDYGEVSKEIKLEYCGCIWSLKDNIEKYDSLEFNNHSLSIYSGIKKETLNSFGIILNKVDLNTVHNGLEILNKHTHRISDFINHHSGLSIGKQIISEDLGDLSIKLVGGRQIDRYGIKEIKGYVHIDNMFKRYIKLTKSSLFIQHIVTYYKKEDLIKFICCVPTIEAYPITSVDHLICHNGISKEVIWGILNSNLIAWYAKNFIYSNSIRSMNVGKELFSKIPVPNLHSLDPNIFKTFHTNIITNKLKNNIAEVNLLELGLNSYVDELYGIDFKYH